MINWLETGTQWVRAYPKLKHWRSSLHGIVFWDAVFKGKVGKIRLYEPNSNPVGCCFRRKKNSLWFFFFSFPLLPLLSMKSDWQGIFNLGHGPSPGTKSVDSLILNFSAWRLRDIFLLDTQPVVFGYGNQMTQPEKPEKTPNTLDNPFKNVQHFKTWLRAFRGYDVDLNMHRSPFSFLTSISIMET